MMTTKEKQLLERFSKYSKEEFNANLSDLPADEMCTKEFLAEMTELMFSVYMKDVNLPQIDFEDALQEWFDKQTDEDKKAFLEEDWREYYGE